MHKLPSLKAYLADRRSHFVYRARLLGCIRTLHAKPSFTRREIRFILLCFHKELQYMSRLDPAALYRHVQSTGVARQELITYRAHALRIAKELLAAPPPDYELRQAAVSAIYANQSRRAKLMESARRGRPKFPRQPA